MAEQEKLGRKVSIFIAVSGVVLSFATLFVKDVLPLFTADNKEEQKQERPISEDKAAAVGGGTVTTISGQVSGGNIQSGNNVMSVGNNSQVRTGIPYESYKKDLEEERQRTKAEMEMAHGIEKQELENKLVVLEAKIADSKVSYEQHIKYLNDRIAALEKIKDGGVSDSLTDEAKEALLEGDDSKADELFKKIEENENAAIERAAYAVYQRAKIAFENVDYKKAYKLYSRAVDLQPEEPLYLNDFGLIAHDLGQYNEAIESLEKALEGYLKLDGEGHHNVATARNNLGLLWNVKGKYDKAQSYYEKALQDYINIYGEDHHSVALTMSNLGGVWKSKGDYDKAIEYYEKALQSDIKRYGEDHPSVALVRSNLGVAWDSKGDYDTAKVTMIKR